ncbi:nSTAND3 domain-containing NTPase [Pedobacter agri]|uniref:nSTAND3 domain-containing NTPase n=1 Tax=Pedobacter agri TaxID=454586 RepID=UPI0029311459|nr:restriction endonuclease [Pedobacter agri]
MRYTLDVLHNKDFEDLAKDILEAELQVQLQSFRSGKDKGIDMRYAMDVENEIIVQAKHYLKSSFSDLKRQIEKEREKMDKLSPKPSRYILFTSFDLSVENCDTLFTLLSPYIKTSQDIYGLSRVESLIAAHPAIEKKHYKLWLTSTSVLEHILHNGIHGKSEFLKSRILQRSKLYVPTQNLDRAVEKLNENRVLIITGEPGVGKTTIAYQLLYGLLADGFELVHIDDSIHDAESILFSDPNKAQVAFFDDFLGPNIAEILNPRNSQSQLVNFVERVRDSKNKLLILTTRTTILNQANQYYHKFKRIGIEQELKYSVVIKEYAKLDKAKILYNHVYHNLEEVHHDVFFNDNFYKTVVEHPNFFPRLVEFITNNKNLNNKDLKSARKFIESSLDNPSEIWEHAYREQLSAEEQFLLVTLFSFGKNDINVELLRRAFNARYDYEIKNNGYVRKLDAFGIALENLANGFISSYLDKESGTVSISLLNPSIADFLLNYLASKPDELKRLFYSVCYTDQILAYFGKGNQYLKIPASEKERYYEHFKARLSDLQIVQKPNTALPLQAVYMYLLLFPDLTKDEDLLLQLNSVDFETHGISDNRYLFILNALANYPLSLNCLKADWWNFLVLGLAIAGETSRMTTYLKQFAEFGITEEIWSKDEAFMDELFYHLNSEFNNMIDDFDYSRVRENVYYHDEDSPGEYDENDIVEIIEREFEHFLDEHELSDYKELFWDRIDYDAARVLARQVEGWNDYSDYYEADFHSGQMPKGEALEDPDIEIDRLFER